MITIYIREHGTHNRGWSFDFNADLNNYTSSESLLEDLYEYTREKIEANGLTYEDEMEEWLITDWEIDNSDFNMQFDEYFNLDKLIEINAKMNELNETEIKLVSALMNNGSTFQEAIESYEDTYYFEGTLEDWAYEMVEEGLFGNINEKLMFYIDYQKLARDLSYEGYVEDNNISFCMN
ncbi:antirestriction protein ArdA [Candidatus Sulfurimonas baltica]|uniref:Antirestriction protein ArdA n=1 Tax=Candidatus Sulfurimonas baltica TaxID=2740404 RepID=A0A7S7RNP1_9BACT|nr:antirestriction protein ArdA [Candidatus Sulfurimonas baltica]QOY52739.1 antirestriction protein ArdA [Candidatus Sulfurimonas baltica]